MSAADPIQDQWQAAAAHNSDVLRRIAQRMPVESAQVPGLPLPGGWTESKPAHSCEHLDPDHPAIMFGLIGVPNVFFCAMCIPDAAEQYARDFPDTCDECGQPSEFFSEVMMQFGPLTITGNVCDGCRR